jgi:Mycoplasma protein of unknown function, DUF285
MVCLKVRIALNISRWDVSSVSDMSGMFCDAVKFNADISQWNVITTNSMFMYSMFPGALSLNANLSLWDVSRVETMASMFAGAESFTGVGLNSWDVGYVYRMSSMFQNATSFDANLSWWNVSRVEDMSFMFKNASKFKGVGLDEWELNPSVATDGMFCNASALQLKNVSIFPSDFNDPYCCDWPLCLY